MADTPTARQFVTTISEAQVGLIAIATSIAISIPAIILACLQYQIARNKARRAFFESCNQRFDSMNEDLEAVCNGKEPVSGKAARAVVQDYLNLCSEEYLGKRDDMVSKPVWKAWEAGIRYYVNLAPIRKVFWAQQRDAAPSYYGFFNFFPVAEPDPEVPGQQS